MLCAMWNLQTRGRTHVPCLGRWVLSHCATREVWCGRFFKKYWVCYKVASFLCFGSERYVAYLLTRDQTGTPCIGRRSLNHWIPREDPVLYFPRLEILNLLWTRNTAFHLVWGLHLCSHKPRPVPDSEAAKPVLLPLSVSNSRLSTLQATPGFPLSAQVFASCFIWCEPP